MFLKNRTVQMKFVKDKELENNTEVTDVVNVNPEEIAQITTEHAIKIVGAVGAVVAVNRVLNTICEIAVIAAKAKFK